MKNTRSVNIDMMKNHGRAVVKFSTRPFTIIDMPYKSYESNESAYYNASQLLNYTKCQSVKIEIINKNNINIVSSLTRKKISVTSHIGITPQAFNNFSKIKAVGRTTAEKNKLINMALRLEDAGSCILLLECVVEDVAKEITSRINIPTIGIGSSVHCDGQILVIDDVLGFKSDLIKPKFVKSYINLSTQIKKSVKKYAKEVRQKKFPTKKYRYK